LTQTNKNAFPELSLLWRNDAAKIHEPRELFVPFCLGYSFEAGGGEIICQDERGKIFEVFFSVKKSEEFYE
jgi:hypothetical protein